ncbi:hypothetical protein CRG98_015575 [Punica granatum]|uniref:NB-ARC domain-containing protein n=1 Tax=Punica granatum TaxID=22663 RepID=A0A2I0K7E6_PUNGR|nr:hypothetical protein CRG98_015575 [Punica granatum]
MAQPVEDTVKKILNHFGEHHVSKVVLAGDAGAGKTWVARKVCESALKEELSYGSIWIVPADYSEKKYQLSLLSCDEEWDDDEDSEEMLITRKESTDSNAGAACESKGDAIQPDDTKAIRLEPLSSSDALILLQGRVKTEVSDNQMLEAIAEKALGLPAGIILVAEALKHIRLEDGVRAFEIAMDDVANLKGDDITAVLQFAYDMLPEGVTRSCYWLSRQLFLSRAAVHFNELITYWILEGCFDNHNLLEKAYEEGHRILMDLKDRGMLKQHGNYVYMERAMLKLPDERRNGFSDGMIRTVCRDKENKGMSTLIIEGGRLCKEVSQEFFKSMKGLKFLAILNPMFEYLPPGLTELEDLQVLVLRGCQHLKKVDEICKLTKLSVLEISGASLLLHIDEDFFKGMANLKTVNLSSLNTRFVPGSLFNRDAVRFLILRECPTFYELPSLRNMRKLEMVDLCGSASFERLSDGNINNLTDLKTLNFSETKVRNLPILGKLAGLTRILLSDCLWLTMIRSLGGMTNLEVLDISGSMNIKDLNSAQLLQKPRFRILDLSRTETEITRLPSLSDLVELRELLLRGCKKLTQLRGLSPLEKLEVLDLSGCCDLRIGPPESFSCMSRLKKLYLSGTKIDDYI